MFSVITAHQPQRKDFLLECYQSLLCQQIDWEWLIQVDNPSSEVLFEDDSRVSWEHNPLPLGAANTRNLALRRARGEIIFSLDDDDKLMPGAFEAAHVSLFAAKSNLFGFAASKAD